MGHAQVHQDHFEYPKVFDAQAVTSTDVHTSASHKTYGATSMAIHSEWTATATGTYDVLFSNDGTNFRSFGATTTPIEPTGTASGGGLTVDTMGFKFFKLEYTNTAGTGAITVRVNMKMS